MMTVPRTSTPPPSPTPPQQLAKFFSRRAGGEVWMASIQFLNWKPHAHFFAWRCFLCVNTVCSVTSFKVIQNWYIRGQAKVFIYLFFLKSNRRGPFLMLAHLAEISFGDNSVKSMKTEVSLCVDGKVPLLQCSRPCEHSALGPGAASCPSAPSCNTAMPAPSPIWGCGLLLHTQNLASSSIFGHYFKAGWGRGKDGRLAKRHQLPQHCWLELRLPGANPGMLQGAAVAPCSQPASAPSGAPQHHPTAKGSLARLFQH